MSREWMPSKPTFGPPPPGYVAGLGRGATGFITRSDLGPSRLPDSKAVTVTPEEIEEAGYDDVKYDQWEGYKGALFSKAQVDQEDKQAEDAYDYCEKKIQGRRPLINLTSKGAEAINAKFVDLKRQLAKITYQEWEQIPQSVDSSIKKRKRERYTPVPDSLIVNMISSNQVHQTVHEGNQNFREAKQVLLRSKLDRAEDAVEGQSNVDKVGYLTQLNISQPSNDFMGDAKKARILLKSALNSNPKNSDLWLSAARVEEIDGKIHGARELLRKAVDQCPTSQDLWLELARVETPEEGKNALIQGLRHLPKSEKIWLYAANAERKDMKSKILRKGLQNNPQSVRLWRQLIELEETGEAKQLLFKAVESLPHEIDLWLALARMQEYQNARKILNKARKANPLSLAVWISAAKLEQTQMTGENDALLRKRVQDVLLKGRQVLSKNGNNVSREEWLSEAHGAECSGCVVTCEAIVKMSVSAGLIPEELDNAILKDTQHFQNERESTLTTRCLFKYGVQATRNQKLLQNMIEFEKRQRRAQRKDDLVAALGLGVKMFPTHLHFWIATIEKLIDQKEFQAANNCIDQAASAIESHLREDILLLRVRICKIKGEIDQARQMLIDLRRLYPKGKSVMESIQLEYELESYEVAWQLCEAYFKEVQPEAMWLIAFRIKRKLKKNVQANALIEKSLEQFPHSEELWKQVISLAEESNQVSKARTLIDRARLKLPQSLELAILNVDFERQHGSAKDHSLTLAKALKAFPQQGELWSRAIECEPAATRKKKAQAGIEACGSGSALSVAVALAFWKEGKVEKTKKWLQEALRVDQFNGDTWSVYLCLLESRFPAELGDKMSKFMQTPIRSGRSWLKEEVEKKREDGRLEVLIRMKKKMERRLDGMP